MTAAASARRRRSEGASTLHSMGRAGKRSDVRDGNSSDSRSNDIPTASAAGWPASVACGASGRFILWRAQTAPGSGDSADARLISRSRASLFDRPLVRGEDGVFADGEQKGSSLRICRCPAVRLRSCGNRRGSACPVPSGRRRQARCPRGTRTVGRWRTCCARRPGVRASGFRIVHRRAWSG